MQTKDFQTKTVLVTGASGDIGTAIAAKFYNAGYRVAIHYYKNREKAEHLLASLTGSPEAPEIPGAQAALFQADLRSPEEITKMFDEIRHALGEVDILVNNAGKGTQILFQDISYECWQDTFAVNTDACFLCCKEALPHMIHEKSGRIINISSIWGLTGASCEVHYSAAKAAVIGFTKALAKELGPSGITVNCVAPGVIDTEMNAHLSETDMEALRDETPLCRIGTPEDVAGAVFFLASNDASFITGQVISPNGGFVI